MFSTANTRQIEALHLGLDARLRELAAVVTQLLINATEHLDRLRVQNDELAAHLDRIEINTRAAAERVAMLHDSIRPRDERVAPSFRITPPPPPCPVCLMPHEPWCQRVSAGFIDDLP